MLRRISHGRSCVLCQALSKRLSSSAYFENDLFSAPRLAKFCSGEGTVFTHTRFVNCTVSFSSRRSEPGPASRGGSKQARSISENLPGLVVPYPEYCSQMWNPHLKKYIGGIEKVQHTFTRISPLKILSECSLPALVASIPRKLGHLESKA